MKSFFIVANANGPISYKLEATSESEAKDEFRSMVAPQLRAIIDESVTELEEALGFSGEGMSDSDFSAALESRGAVCVAPSQIVGEWEIWSVDDE